ncbi:hypothetical protein [Fictibacillus arsenicus]|uniref:Glycoside transferase n=1 Tax=Fictibacillus arsenicus TaxID=255247 RepID=A0A1V3GBY0_9BACL|nr:hypothetical protein [Fictibacillus arsenicus]OOE14386.1 hypothetical protein UN64_04095 [Fictibacillus arsenicus]
MRKYRYYLYPISLFCLIITFILLVNNNKPSDKTNIINQYYLTNNSLVKNYGRSNDLEFLSESMGLYLEYLLLIENEKEFNKIFNVFESKFILKKDGLYHIKWRLEDYQSTNALIDDLRIIRVLKEASVIFDNRNFLEIANKLSNSLTFTHMNGGYFTDFYDWNYKQHANELHLSYIDTEALTQSSQNIDFQSLQQKGNDETSPFFLEVLRIQKNKYEPANPLTVNMIDQMLIAIQVLKITDQPPFKFDQWLKSELLNNKKIYGQYKRDSLVPLDFNESSAVYSLLTLYFLEQKDKQLAKKSYELLRRQLPLQKEPNYEEIHFFDFIHSVIADYKYKNQK